MTDYDVYDHRDVQASCMDLDVSGRKIVLAGKKCIAITDASDPEKASAKFYRRNKFDMACVRFCPHIENRHQIAAASSQSYEIYVMQSNGIQMLGAGRAHSRNITDLDWDRHNSYQFATCSVDDCVHVWDVRDLKKPSLSLNVIAGAVQIKWCKRLQHIFATAHDGDIRLWDARKTSMPIQIIAAHLSKVLSFDWNSKNDVSFVSSSLDRTVKVFDFTKPNEPEISFTSSTPVWKARFAPFGDAILTTPFPQVGRIEHTVTLWNANECPASIVHTFSGHNDLILDFCLRKVCSNNEEVDSVQLYTLCKDFTLRLWTIDSKLQSLCVGKNAGSAVASASSAAGYLLSQSDGMPQDRQDFNYTEFVENFERIMATSSSLSTNFKQQQQHEQQHDDLAPQSSFSLNRSDGSSFDWDREMTSLLQLKSIPNVKLEEIDRPSRSFITTVDHRRYIVKLKIFLPTESILPDRPGRTEICIKFSRETNLPAGVKLKVLKTFQNLCIQKHGNEGSIFEACLRNLPKCLDQCLSESEGSSDTQPSTASPNAVVSMSEQFLAFVNSRVPFPATCGARFCSAGVLVCFSRMDGPINSPPPSFDGISPRSFADLYSRTINLQSLAQQTHASGYFSGVASKDPYDLKNFYYPNRDLLTRKKHRIESTNGLRFGIDQTGDEDQSYADLLIYGISGLFPYTKSLAQLLRLVHGDISETCLFNAEVSANAGRNDLNKLANFLSIDHYSRCGDIQTAAILCCVLGVKTRISSPKIAHRNITATDFLGGSSTYNTVHSTYGLREALSGPIQRQRTGSFTEELDACGLANGHDSLSTILEHTGNNANGNGSTSRKDKACEEGKIRENDMRLLDPTMTEKFEKIRQSYADLLFRWGLLNERAEILQYCNKLPHKMRGPEYWTLCKSCGSECKGAVCLKCKTYAMICSICKAPVKGLTSACVLCAHGGHNRHLIGWFADHTKCPSGCGCTCSLA